MMTEGTGVRSPSPVKIQLSTGDMSMLREAAARLESARYGKRQDTWGKGLVSSPMFVGLCGEHACCVFLNRKLATNVQVDTVLRSHGDGGADIVLMGLRIQVKTRSVGKRNLIRRIDGEKRVRGLSVHAFVFAQLFESTRLVHLLGWCHAADTRKNGRLSKSARGDWWNIELEGKHLLPMNDLATEISTRGYS